MTAKTRAANKSAILAAIASNGIGAITDPILRTILTDLMDSVAVNGEMAMSDITGLVAALASIPDTTALAATVPGHTASIGSLNSTVATHTTQIATALAGQTPNALVSGGIRVRADPNGAYFYMPTFADNDAAVAGGLVDGHLYITPAGNVRGLIPGSGGGSGGTTPPGKSLLGTFHATMNDSTTAAMLGGWPSRWGSRQFTENFPTNNPTNTVERSTASPFEGTAFIRCFSEPKLASFTPKACLIRTLSGAGFTIQPNDVSITTWRMRVLGGANLGELYWLDVEDTLNGSQGIRMKFNSSGMPRIDREFTSPRARSDDAGRTSPSFPRNEWVKVTVRMGYSRSNSAAGFVVVYYNDNEVCSILNCQTMASSGTYNQIQAGITANPAASGHTMDIDDFKMEVYR